MGVYSSTSSSETPSSSKAAAVAAAAVHPNEIPRDRAHHGRTMERIVPSWAGNAATAWLWAYLC